MEILLIVGIFLALVFNFLNGLHDAANSISTVIATRVLSPLRAVALAAVLNLIGPLFLTTAIAETISKGVVSPGFLTLEVIIIGILVASFWIFFTAYIGIPISSTHAMVGGLLGSAVAYGGFQALILPNLDTILKIIIFSLLGAICGAGIFSALAKKLNEEHPRAFAPIGALIGVVIAIPATMALNLLNVSGIVKIALFIVISPCLGFIIAFTLGIIVIRRWRNASSTLMNKRFNRLQILSASFYSIGHGSNDAQHAMGVITAMLVISGNLTNYSVPLWVILLSSGAISLGTLTGGWKIVQTMAKKITHLKPYQGFCAETGGGLVLVFVSLFGIPVSSTHAISGCIMGVGATRGSSAVQWSVVRQIVSAWIITIPLTAVCGFLIFSVFQIVSGSIFLS